MSHDALRGSRPRLVDACLEGVVAVLFGLAALFWPGKTLFVLILLFGAYTLVDGIFAIVGGKMDSSRRWLLLIEGVRKNISPS